ncbi:O-antigen ligase family protein [Rosistilla oblonga]|uniref:O-Antigen ligase n=1 Tax=Rosistilla oblonga TaxID=2527990 RepID=A0A518IPG9_9BACT|nr:O-antigen ligase family protein [Rosistilla oblonga]QDV54967.1 O-Antigen ligase [Rosistilla oblonga]
MATVAYSRVDERPVATSGSGRLVTSFVGALVFAVVFLNAADFRGDTGEEFSVHWQIYLRLLICAVCGGTGILLVSKSYRAFLTFPGFLITLLIAWIGVTLPFSVDRTYSLAAYVSLGAVAMLIPAAMQILGGYRYLMIVAAGLVTFIVGSWIAYLVFPEIGIFKEQITQTEVLERMGGLGHPNELGLYSAFTTVLFAVLGYGRRLSYLIVVPAMLLSLVTLVVCFSRTSMGITLVGLLVVYRKELFTQQTVIATLLLAILAIPPIFVVAGTGGFDWLVGDALEKLSKSGTADELTTATGRTDIWAYAIQRIGEQPLHGYGYMTARFVMEKYSYHCHNIVLNMCLNTGVIGGMTLLSMVLYFVYAIYHDPRYEVDGLVAVILAGGLIDGLLFAAVPSAAVLIWFSALLWRQLDMQFDPPQPKTL